MRVLGLDEISFPAIALRSPVHEGNSGGLSGLFEGEGQDKACRYPLWGLTLRIFCDFADLIDRAPMRVEESYSPRFTNAPSWMNTLAHFAYLQPRVFAVLITFSFLLIGSAGAFAVVFA